MAVHRQYDKRTKLAAVMAADMAGVVQAEKQTGINESTIRYWMQRPEFAEIRAKTRADLAGEIGLVAHLAWQRTAEALQAGTMEPRDILFAAEKATSLELLMRGEATSRSEVTTFRDYDDEERRALRRALDRALDQTAEPAGPGGAAAERAGAEVR